MASACGLGGREKQTQGSSLESPWKARDPTGCFDGCWLNWKPGNPGSRPSAAPPDEQGRGSRRMMSQTDKRRTHDFWSERERRTAGRAWNRMPGNIFETRIGVPSGALWRELEQRGAFFPSWIANTGRRYCLEPFFPGCLFPGGVQECKTVRESGSAGVESVDSSVLPPLESILFREGANPQTRESATST